MSPVEFRTQNRIFQNLRAFLSNSGSALTDFNVGSVINSVLYAFSNGLASLYATLQNVYDGTFVARATGDDLDNRVTDFNLTRRLATRATGNVTFYRSLPSTSDVIITVGTRVKTITTNLIQGVEFLTTSQKLIQTQIVAEPYTFLTGQTNINLISRKVYDINTVTGTAASVSGYTFIKNTDYSLNSADASQAKIQWLGGGVSPDDSTVFYVTYQPLSVDVPVQSSGAGAFGNVATSTIVNVPSKPAGVEEVINYESTSGGTDIETDDQLRIRVPLYLSSLSKSTKNAIQAAALSVNGIQNANIYESDPPNGFVTIFIDDGSGGASLEMIRNVKDKIDGTINGVETGSATAMRACGLGVNVLAPTVKDITISLTAFIDTGFDSTSVSIDIETTINQYLNAFVTGQSILRASLIEKIMGVQGVKNIDLSVLTVNGALTGDTTVGTNEVARLFSINILTR